jgi:hypothetical protein
VPKQQRLFFANIIAHNCGLLSASPNLRPPPLLADHGAELHVGGRLGFHAPYIDPAKSDDQKYSRREIADAFKAAIISVSDAIELFDRRASGGPGINEDNRPSVNASLFVEMLRKGADELFVIDTVSKAGRWGNCASRSKGS